MPLTVCRFASEESTVLSPPIDSSRVSPFQRDVLIRRGVGEQRNLAEAGFGDPRPRAVDEGELPDRRVDDPLGHDLLDLV